MLVARNDEDRKSQPHKPSPLSKANSWVGIFQKTWLWLKRAKGVLVRGNRGGTLWGILLFCAHYRLKVPWVDGNEPPEWSFMARVSDMMISFSSYLYFHYYHCVSFSLAGRPSIVEGSRIEAKEMSRKGRGNGVLRAQWRGFIMSFRVIWRKMSIWPQTQRLRALGKFRR